jgi:predicted flap endonuclease-1-like 5' DNA nuclease
MTFDTVTIVLIGVILLGVAIMVLGIVSQRRKPRVERRTGESGSLYVASKERPYMAAPPPRGAGVADEVATATTDVAGEVLGVDVVRAPAGPADDLRKLKGVGPKFVARLGELGITRFDQLAGLNANEAAHLDERMGPFQGRLAKDRVIEQADLLARHDIETFEEKFGKLGG